MYYGLVTETEFNPEYSISNKYKSLKRILVKRSVYSSDYENKEPFSKSEDYIDTAVIIQ